MLVWVDITPPKLPVVSYLYCGQSGWMSEFNTPELFNLVLLSQ